VPTTSEAGPPPTAAGTGSAPAAEEVVPHYIRPHAAGEIRGLAWWGDVLLTLDTRSGRIALVDRDGLAALSMRRLGSDLNISYSGLYVYVSGREELLMALIARELETLLPRLHAIARQTDPVLALTRTLAALLDALRDSPVMRSIGAEFGMELANGHDQEPAIIGELRELLIGTSRAAADQRPDVSAIELIFVARAAIMSVVFDRLLDHYDDETWLGIRDRLVLATRVD
jgi:AcrR family transcriptional regulator